MIIIHGRQKTQNLPADDAAKTEQQRQQQTVCVSFTAKIHARRRRIHNLLIFLSVLVVMTICSYHGGAKPAAKKIMHVATSSDEEERSQGFDNCNNNKNYTQSIFLPYIYEFNSTKVPLVRSTIHGVDIEMPVDTGSTGLLIGAPLLPDLDPTQGTPAYHYLTSSNILYVGRLVPLAIEFHGLAGSRAIARVPALVVDRSLVCPWYDPRRDTFECPPGKDGEKPVERNTSRIMYMGVGFARNTPGNGQPDAVPSRNPLLNIVSIDGEKISSALLKTGYIISTRGVEIGLTEKNLRGFSFTSLEPGVTHNEDARDWASVRANFSINGQVGSFGYGLVDTGISQMYIRAEDGVSIPTIWVPNPNPNGTAKEVERVSPGTQIDIDFVSATGEKVMGYNIVVGQPSIMEPSSVRPAKRSPPPFLNTGRNFLFGYSIAFDAVDGRFGFRAVVDTVPPLHPATSKSIRSLLA